MKFQLARLPHCIVNDLHQVKLVEVEVHSSMPFLEQVLEWRKLANHLWLQHNLPRLDDGVEGQHAKVLFLPENGSREHIEVGKDVLSNLVDYRSRNRSLWSKYEPRILRSINGHVVLHNLERGRVIIFLKDHLTLAIVFKLAGQQVILIHSEHLLVDFHDTLESRD
jgi:hypothetical protein